MNEFTQEEAAQMDELAKSFRLQEDLKSGGYSSDPCFKLDYTNKILRVDWLKPRYYMFKDITDAQLLIDEKTTSGKSTTNMLGRAALFGVFTGGAGAIVGALTAKSEVKRDIKKVTIQVMLPRLRYNHRGIAVPGEPVVSEHTLYKSGSFKGYAPEEAIQVGTKVVKAILAGAQPTAVAPSPPDLAGGLAALAELHAKGMLTEAEFASAKQRLLG